MEKKRKLRKSRKIIQMMMMKDCVLNFRVKKRKWQSRLKELENKIGEPVINNMSQNYNSKSKIKNLKFKIFKQKLLNFNKN